MFDYIKASMLSNYEEDIEMISEELSESNIKFYKEKKMLERYGEIIQMHIIHAKINTPEELSLLVEKVAAGGIEMSFEFKSNFKK